MRLLAVGSLAALGCVADPSPGGHERIAQEAGRGLHGRPASGIADHGERRAHVDGVPVRPAHLIAGLPRHETPGVVVVDGRVLLAHDVRGDSPGEQRRARAEREPRERVSPGSGRRRLVPLDDDRRGEQGRDKGQTGHPPNTQGDDNSFSNHYSTTTPMLVQGLPR